VPIEEPPTPYSSYARIYLPCKRERGPAVPTRGVRIILNALEALVVDITANHSRGALPRAGEGWGGGSWLPVAAIERCVSDGHERGESA
jgi:hypothetical protein